MIRIYIGYDKDETIAYHVLAHSIMRHSSIPVSIVPLNRDNLRGIYDRPRTELESTDFSMSRFMVPYLCNYQGWAVFMDCDMLCLGDVRELANYMSLADRWTRAVGVVKHSYDPKSDRKFLGQRQTAYEKKNWSSLMIFNNSLCHKLTPDYVHNATGLDLHQFRWVDPDKVWSVPAEWNYLVGEGGQRSNSPKLIHFTLGGPYFEDTRDCEYSDLWLNELKLLNHARQK